MLTGFAFRLLFSQTLNLDDRVLEVGDCGISRHASEICGRITTVQNNEARARTLANSQFWPHIIYDPDNACDIDALIKECDPTYLVMRAAATPSELGNVAKILAPHQIAGFTVRRRMFGIEFMTNG